MKKVIFLKGGLRSEMVTFNKTAREITVYGDISFNGQRFFKNLPIVRLVVTDVSMGNHNDEALVCDEYSRFIPYLKSVKAFRILLEQELIKLKSNVDKLGNVGIDEYLAELRTFSETKSIIREAKTLVNQLKPEKIKDIEIAHRIFAAMDIYPSADNLFEVA
jgi:hypothetical protein